MEGLVMLDIYKDKVVMVTGAYGFKGSWLCEWLRKLGAAVVEYGHPPSTEPNHHNLLGYVVGDETRQDLLDYYLLLETMVETEPDLVIHLAARAIVARTFTEPRETFENNVMGAVNILEACRLTPSVEGVVFITTDKVYEDKNWGWGYRENDELGGYDPYSASKVCCEHVIQCYRKSFGLNIATARAGNVIGGGDWSFKRLIPDIVRATAKGEKVVVHTPNATRPWQHVLDALYGYLLLGEKILKGEDVNRAWNFGPTEEMSVLDILTIAKEVWPEVCWEVNEADTHPFMVYLLKLDSSESYKRLGWKPRWGMKYSVARAVRWYKEYYETGKILTNNDIEDYTYEL
jgi:CDP-glucose 4,6-dehydratase